MVSDAPPGVKVVEGPLSSMLDMSSKPSADDLYRGRIFIAVEPNVEYDLDGNSPPLKFEKTDEERSALALESRKEGERAARAIMKQQLRTKPSVKFCKDYSESAGWIENTGGEKVLSVKLSDRCNCDSQAWTKTTCGHHFCTLCNGYVCSASRVALKGAGPIIECNRKPMKDYEQMFMEHAPKGGTYLTKIFNEAIEPPDGDDPREVSEFIRGIEWRPSGEEESQARISKN